MGESRPAGPMAVELSNQRPHGRRGWRRAERRWRARRDRRVLSKRPSSNRASAPSEVVLPAMFLRDGLLDALSPFAPLFAGKLYIDITNPFNTTYTDFILPWDTSGAEEIQRTFPEALVVGAFKNVWWEVFDAPEF